MAQSLAYHWNLVATDQDNEVKGPPPPTSFELNKTRLLIFLGFGTVVGGPAFHYWLNFLDRLPALLLKRAAERGDGGRFTRFVQTKPRMLQVLTDQLVFSPIYTMVFFLSIGLAEGAAEKVSAEMTEKANQEEMMKKRRAYPPLPNISSSTMELLTLEEKTPLPSSPTSSSSTAATSSVSSTATSVVPTWTNVWEKTLSQIKAVYIPTYATDWLFWPPVQLLNFTFVPLPYQFLFVNLANLVWNTFLSLMSAKGGKDVNQEEEERIMEEASSEI